MLTSIPQYTTPGAIIPLTPVNASDVNDLLTDPDQINDSLDKATNNIKSNITSNTVLNQNADVSVFVDSTSGSITITLPSGSGQIKPITIQKVDGTYNDVIIARAGSDLITNPWNPILAPIETQIKLTIPGDSVELFWDGTYWRAVNFSSTNRVLFSAYTTTTQSIIAAADTKFYFESELYDIGSFYNAGLTGNTSRFTPLVEGYYKFDSIVRTNNASTPVALNLSFYKTGVLELVKSVSPNNNGNAGGTITMEGSVIAYMNGSSDYMEVFLRMPGGVNGNSNSSQATTRFSGELIARA